jgi:hypothetical protein
MRTHRTTLTALALVLAGCSSETVAQLPPAPANWQSLHALPVADAGPDTVTALERGIPDIYVKAISSRAGEGTDQFADLAPLLNTDLAGFTSPGMPPAHEPKAIVAAHDKLFGAFDDRKMVLARVWRTPAEQTLEWVMSGTQNRDWNGVTATHKPVIFKGVTLLWTKDDGTIIDIHVYLDVALVKAQLGIGPKELLGSPQPTLPSGAPQVLEQATTSSVEDDKNVGVVKAALDAIENNKEPVFLGTMTDDLQIETLEHSGGPLFNPLHGKTDAKAYYEAMHKAIGQLDTTIISAWGIAPYAIVEYSIAGEQLGPIGWIPAKRDNVVRFEVVDLCEIRDGKMAHVWRYDSPGEMLEP